MLRRPLPPILFLLLACSACEPDTPPGDVVLPDDDDAADDDDDATDDDDDDVPAYRHARGVVVEYTHHGDSDLPEGLLAAELSFFTRGDPVPMGNLAGLADGPIPGLGLHPALRPDEDDACVELSSTDLPTLPNADDVGGTVVLQGEDRDLELPRSGDRYGLAEAEGELPPGELFGLRIEGGAGWSAASWNEVATAPSSPASVLPSSGPVAGIVELNYSWQAAGDPAGVELLLVRFEDGDASGWTAVRCVVVDDGQARAYAGALAPIGSGPIHALVSRAHWTQVEGDELTPSVELGLVRTDRALLVPGG